MALDTPTGNPSFGGSPSTGTGLDPAMSPFPTAAGMAGTGPAAGSSLGEPTLSERASTVDGPGAPQRFIERMVQGAHEAIDRAASVAVPAVDRLSTQARRAGHVVNDRADQLGTMQDQWIADARDTVRQHPLAMVAGGLALGWLIGRLTAR